MVSPARENTKEYKFLVELDDELKCQICLGVARDPLQHEECGKLFCKDCLEEYGKNKPCPNCRQDHLQYYIDKRGKRAIEALRVKCHNSDRKCLWEGTVGTIEAHVATCDFTLLPCPNQCKDDKAETNHYMRKELDQHLQHHCPNRHFKCQYCGEEDTYATITHTHDEVCQRKPIPCPNKECKVTMQRGVVADHVEHECDYTVIPCKYRSFGCNVERKRRDMATHEHGDKQFHLDMAMDAIQKITKDSMELRSDHAKLKSDNQELKNDCEKLKNETDKLQSEVTKLSSAVHELQLISLGSPKIFSLLEYEKVKKKGQRYKFPPFYMNPKSYHVSLWVDAGGYGSAEGTHISVFMNIVKGDYDADLNWPLLGEVTFTLLNQLEDKNHHTKTVGLTAYLNAQVDSISGHQSWGFPEFIPNTALNYDPVKKTQYLKDDTLYFKMNVELKH